MREIHATSVQAAAPKRAVAGVETNRFIMFAGEKLFPVG